MNIIIKNKRLTALMIYLSVLLYANAQMVTIDGLMYYLNKDSHEAIVDNGNSWTGELVIPSEVNYNGETFTVTSLCWGAFYNCRELTKVKIPKTVEGIDNKNYSESRATRAVSPNYKNPFFGCTSLEASFSYRGGFHSDISGVLFSKDGAELFSYPAGMKAESYVVPQGVTWIGGASFSFSEHLVSVEMPASVVTIGGGIILNAACARNVALIIFPAAKKFSNPLTFSASTGISK